MRKDKFLKSAYTENFVHYLNDLLSKKESLHFLHASGCYESFDDALAAYRWPNRKINIPTPQGNFVIVKNSNFAENKIVLDRLSLGFKNAFEATDREALTAWAKSIMIWGGVYTKKGNAKWLEENQSTIDSYLASSISVLTQDDDEAPLQMKNLRSNAGTSKIYSLLLPNYIIYDSRVAASLAWLVAHWANKYSVDVPEYLRFSCMKPNSRKQKVRSPDKNLFPYFSATGKLHHRHAMWNIRANWIVDAVLKYNDKKVITTIDSRGIEAALFMLGEDLTHNLRK